MRNYSRFCAILVDSTKVRSMTVCMRSVCRVGDLLCSLFLCTTMASQVSALVTCPKYLNILANISVDRLRSSPISLRTNWLVSLAIHGISRASIFLLSFCLIVQVVLLRIILRARINLIFMGLVMAPRRISSVYFFFVPSIVVYFRT